MICPVEIARDLSAFRAARVGEHAEHVLLHAGRDGAGDESTGSGLFDRRQGKPSPQRVPVALVEQVLGLYRDRYFDLNVRHFHEKLQHEHQIELS